ncbi:hypothetical protein HK414_26270 [Ramlibacter terrae]|uniref:DUF1311 domain-containing protein n=1 Tax=Ramlibacter terrae TaxID=2732511 RepID=A0ABX6P7N1_9BURK|nr:hypothetical protein HK414_26270 [Ramlibacter terrae]
MARGVQRALLLVRSGESAPARARSDFAACQRRTDTLLAAREHALGAYVRAGTLRGDREADAAWLSHDQHVRADREISP